MMRIARKKGTRVKSAGRFLVTVGTMVRGISLGDFYSANLVMSCRGVIVLMIEAETRLRSGTTVR